jgi:outer membrane receptor protein involved in Fe transport
LKPKLIGCLLFFFHSVLIAQDKPRQILIAGDVMDARNNKALVGATITVSKSGISTEPLQTLLTDENGSFFIEKIAFGYYGISIKMMGYGSFKLDSIHIRADRSDFNLGDIKLSIATTDLETVTIFAEKPLIENKDGKITYNASESALSAGATATELLKQTPLVTVDDDGKIQMRGKDVKVLIDSKPVEMNARQLQDLLESMPGSMIEKIEVLTNPPPQFANERGGIINIVTKKGKVGKSGRINFSAGSRGELGLNGSYSYRKKKFSFNLNTGFNYSKFLGNSYSVRNNLYADSSNFFKTIGENQTKNLRPNFQAAVNYDFNKKHSISMSSVFNTNSVDGLSATEYSNINQFDDLYRLSNRAVTSDASSRNLSGTLGYAFKINTAGEVLRIVANGAASNSDNSRFFYQQFLSVDSGKVMSDSTQQQLTNIGNRTISLRVNYDKPFKDKKTLLSFTAVAQRLNTHNQLQTSYRTKTDSLPIPNDLLSNNFEFYQHIFSFNSSVRYLFTPNLSVTTGLQQEWGSTAFNIVNNPLDYSNSNYSLLPFFTLQQKWKNGYNITGSYKRSIQRPEIGQLNPSIDYADPYNIRFGNPFLLPYFSDNFDVIGGYWNKNFNLNVSVGYNALQQIYSSIRTLQPDGKTQTSWFNLSGRKEYEASIWGGFSLGKNWKINANSRYVYNVYSAFDQTNNRFKNNGGLNTSVNFSYFYNQLFSVNGNMNYHRFANPQGTVRNNVRTTVGTQHKFLKKNLTLGFVMVDPFRQQQFRNYIQAPNYNLETYSISNTRNFRITASYNFRKMAKKKAAAKKPAAPKNVQKSATNVKG